MKLANAFQWGFFNKKTLHPNPEISIEKNTNERRQIIRIKKNRGKMT